VLPCPHFGGDPGHGLAGAAGDLPLHHRHDDLHPALKLTSVADVAIVFATCPFVAAAFAWIWFRERATPLTLAASLLAFAGVVLTVAGGGAAEARCWAISWRW
jgi:EamA-like transporter family.